jgi:hypothetical protein
VKGLFSQQYFSADGMHNECESMRTVVINAPDSPSRHHGARFYAGAATEKRETVEFEIEEKAVTVTNDL